MPKSVVSKKKLFREFSKLNQRYVKNNYLKYLRIKIRDFCSQKDIFEKELMFLIWAYDLEFWTLKYAADDYDYSEKKLAERVVYPLVKEGYVYKHFDKLTPSDTYEDHLLGRRPSLTTGCATFITQKARLLVQDFYNKLLT